MAGGQERVLRRRIKSVQATRKITKAMELIAASQIQRTQARIAANRPYKLGMQRIIIEAAKGDPAAAAKMFGTPETPETAVIVVIAGDRGLSGPFNTNVLRATERLIAELKGKGTQTVRLVVVGKKAPSYLRFRGHTIDVAFQGFADKPEFANAREVAQTAAAYFSSGEAQLVTMVSTEYLSAGTQKVTTRQLLPLVDPRDDEDDTPATTELSGYVEFEPDAERLLADLAPRALESEIFSALLEGSASFFASQQRAMAAATENADDLSQNLSRIMNRARQDAITTEIMEIVGGAEALRQEKGA